MSNPFKRNVNLPPELEAVRAKCFHPTGTFVEFHEEEIEQSIPNRFEKIVRQYPDRIAVKDGHPALTYSALNARAILYRGLIARQGKKANVGLVLPGAPSWAPCWEFLKAEKSRGCRTRRRGSRIQPVKGASGRVGRTRPHHFTLA